MNTLFCGSLSALALLAFASPLRAQGADPGVELAFMPRTMTVTLLNEGGKYVAIDLEAKRAAIAKAEPITKSTRLPRWRTDNDLLTWLESL